MSLLEASAAPRSDAPARESVGGGAVRWALRLGLWLVILAGIGVIAAAVVVPRLGGATPYTVLTGSMQPGLPPGTLVVVKPVAAADLRVGSVITYQLHSGEATVVTHRVVAVRSDLRGEIEWQTQGDANDVADRDWVRPEQVRGELWYAVPHLGRVSTLLNGDQRQLAVYAAAGSLVLYAGYMFVTAGGDRRQRRP